MSKLQSNDPGTGMVGAIERRCGLIAVAAFVIALGMDCAIAQTPATVPASKTANLDATLLWFENFETGNYDRWTSIDYGNGWNNGLRQENGFTSDRAKSQRHSHLSKITGAIGQSHRGYGTLQFNGDTALKTHTNRGQGIEAPHGVVNIYWSWLDVPYSFSKRKWFSFWTVNNDAGWKDEVITLGLEDKFNRLTPAHITNSGGTVTYVANAPTFPLRQWVRTTIYINYHKGEMHIWQDGKDLLHATFSRKDTDISQWHWGAYAAKSNDDITMYEDDICIWKLNEPLTDFTTEPQLGKQPHSRVK